MIHCKRRITLATVKIGRTLKVPITVKLEEVTDIVTCVAYVVLLGNLRNAGTSVLRLLLLYEKIYAPILSVKVNLYVTEVGAIITVRAENGVTEIEGNGVICHGKVLPIGKENPILILLTLVKTKHVSFFLELDSDGFLSVIKSIVTANLNLCSNVCHLIFCLTVINAYGSVNVVNKTVDLIISVILGCPAVITVRSIDINSSHLFSDDGKIAVCLGILDACFVALALYSACILFTLGVKALATVGAFTLTLMVACALIYAYIKCTSNIEALAAIRALALAGVSRGAVMTCALVLTHSLGAGFIQAFSTLGTLALTLVRKGDVRTFAWAIRVKYTHDTFNQSTGAKRGGERQHYEQ